jgi:hypothetical protein
MLKNIVQEIKKIDFTTSENRLKILETIFAVNADNSDEDNENIIMLIYLDWGDDRHGKMLSMSKKELQLLGKYCSPRSLCYIFDTFDHFSVQLDDSNSLQFIQNLDFCTEFLRHCVAKYDRVDVLEYCCQEKNKSCKFFKCYIEKMKIDGCATSYNLGMFNSTKCIQFFKSNIKNFPIDEEFVLNGMICSGRNIDICQDKNLSDNDIKDYFLKTFEKKKFRVESILGSTFSSVPLFQFFLDLETVENFSNTLKNFAKFQEDVNVISWMIRKKDEKLSATDFIFVDTKYNVGRFMQPENIESFIYLLDHFRNSCLTNAHDVKIEYNDCFRRVFLKLFTDESDVSNLDQLVYGQLIRLLLRMSENNIIDCFSLGKEEKEEKDKKMEEENLKRENSIKFKNLLTVAKNYIDELEKELMKIISCKDLVLIILHFL